MLAPKKESIALESHPEQQMSVTDDEKKELGQEEPTALDQTPADASQNQ